MAKEDLPPYLDKNVNLILFDGVCKLCNFWAKFIIKYDKKQVFILASVQSKQGQAILKYFDMPTETFDTMLLVGNNKSHKKSTAFFEIVRRLPFVFRILMVFVVIPRPVRDWMYDRVALNRYKLFGQYEKCLLPTPDHENRFLK